VEELVGGTEGRTVVTSDHGNLIGERIAPLDGKRYGHPLQTDVDGLRRVPWLVVEGSARRRVESEPPRENEDIDGSVVRNRLSDLGYVDL
ncbi:hypothetical protein DJ73_06075, partial [Halorubrum sp. Ea1]